MQEPRVVQDAEVDLLRRGKIEIDGKLLWIRKDTQCNCGSGFCYFLKCGECKRVDNAPDCMVQNVYYLDYKTKREIETSDFNNESLRIVDSCAKCIGLDAVSKAIIAKRVSRYKTYKHWLYGFCSLPVGRRYVYVYANLFEFEMLASMELEKSDDPHCFLANLSLGVLGIIRGYYVGYDFPGYNETVEYLQIYRPTVQQKNDCIEKYQGSMPCFDDANRLVRMLMRKFMPLMFQVNDMHPFQYLHYFDKMMLEISELESMVSGVLSVADVLSSLLSMAIVRFEGEFCKRLRVKQDLWFKLDAKKSQR